MSLARWYIVPVACAEAVCEALCAVPVGMCTRSHGRAAACAGVDLCAVPVSDGVCTMVEAEAVRWYIVPVAIAEAVCEALCARCGYVYALA